MHDIKWIREHKEEFDRGLKRRGLPGEAEKLLAIDEAAILADAEVAIGEEARLLRGDVELLAHAVQDDEIVALAVHLGEADFHGVSAGFGN